MVQTLDLSSTETGTVALLYWYWYFSTNKLQRRRQYLSTMAARFVSPLFKAAKTAAPRAPSAARALSAAAEAGEKPNPWLKVDVSSIAACFRTMLSFVSILSVLARDDKAQGTEAVLAFVLVGIILSDVVTASARRSVVAFCLLCWPNNDLSEWGASCPKRAISCLSRFSAS